MIICAKCSCVVVVNILVLFDYKYGGSYGKIAECKRSITTFVRKTINYL